MHEILDAFAVAAPSRTGVPACSVILRTGDRFDQVASSDPAAAACDQLEVDDGAGPCLEAIRQLSSVVVDDLDVDRRWPRWNRRARVHGYRSFVALPGYVDEVTTVALNAYSRLPAAWTRDEVIRIDLYVQELATTLREQGT
ncbi:GAF domain-containing protein [Cellulomonas sp. Y8]|uniref:GAF domain-containing protein n=1 Tax=Cellulomonas sp. Y8 TaxID=2591145 RepID=UPI00143D9478|nr:GAF domain-containing protein [Cellulomonas sp. Y8]